jgi:hypothetical protein
MKLRSLGVTGVRLSMLAPAVTSVFIGGRALEQLEPSDARHPAHPR